jgi:hypothetical protein
LVKCFREEDSPVVERVVGYIREMRFQMWKTPCRATQDVTSVPTASAQRVDPARGQETRISNSRKAESRDAPALQLQESTAGQRYRFMCVFGKWSLALSCLDIFTCA